MCICIVFTHLLFGISKNNWRLIIIKDIWNKTFKIKIEVFGSLVLLPIFSAKVILSTGDNGLLMIVNIWSWSEKATKI